ncbi:ARL14 effector protein-like [Sipha flava]|uniref:ARL14 effector protein-like n=1 Tax=Sipha flava TaxID=143950 RepID=A0A8B8GNA3_9HEMI|nr:ARL14 effector protein-like [Sipha flava]
MSSPNTDALSPRIKKKKLDSLELDEVEHESDSESLTVDDGPCDCCDTDCPGCFLPCESCRSVKCGPQCRVGREWKYESVIIQGK